MRCKFKKFKRIESEEQRKKQIGDYIRKKCSISPSTVENPL